MNIVINLIISIYIVQRLFELYLSRKNERILIAKYHASYAYRSDSSRMRLFHSLWFVVLIIESNFKSSIISLKLLLPILIILVFAQIIRLYTMKTLGMFWTVSIMKMEKRPVYDRGLFRILRHPNYTAVILELIFIPLIFKAYFTLIFFSLLNLYVLKKRIELEEEELISSSDYKNKFEKIKRLIPLIY